MYLTHEQLQTYEMEGFLLLPECFSADEVALMKAQLPALCAEDSPRKVVEKDGNRVRSVYGSHATNEVFGRLCRSPRLVCPTEQILGGSTYVYQFKINAKAAFDGDVWEWHQDFIFWHKEDGMPHPVAVSVVVFLDDVNEFNGPMMFVPRSHRDDMVDTGANNSVFEQETVYSTGPSWISNLTAALKYSLDRQTVARMASRYGVVAPTGPAGSVLFFHCNLFHCSTNNMSPFDRSIAITTYNRHDNAPGQVQSPRPDFLCSRDIRPIVPLADDVLVGAK